MKKVFCARYGGDEFILIYEKLYQGRGSESGRAVEAGKLRNGI